MKYTQSAFVVCLLAVLNACSYIGTEKEYKVQVGGWQDMDQYKHDREHAIKQTDKEKGEARDCNIRDCPDMVRDDGIEN